MYILSPHKFWIFCLLQNYFVKRTLHFSKITKTPLLWKSWFKFLNKLKHKNYIFNWVILVHKTWTVTGRGRERRSSAEAARRGGGPLARRRDVGAEAGRRRQPSTRSRVRGQGWIEDRAKSCAIYSICQFSTGRRLCPVLNSLTGGKNFVEAI